MANKPRAKGTAWETACTKFLLPVWRQAVRTGSRAYELGDLARTPPFTFECKAWARWGHKDVARWMDQAEAARQRTKTRFKALLVKRPYKATERGYVVMELGEFRDLMQQLRK